MFMQILRQFYRIHRVNQAKAAGHKLSLVALQMPDEVPAQRQGGEGLLLGKHLLHVIFAEINLPQGVGHGHRLGGVGFRHRNKGNIFRFTPGGAGGFGHAIAHGGETLLQSGAALRRKGVQRVFHGGYSSLAVFNTCKNPGSSVQPSRTLTHSSRCTRCSSKVSISLRASMPICFKCWPFLPMTMPL